MQARKSDSYYKFSNTDIRNKSNGNVRWHGGRRRRRYKKMCVTAAERTSGYEKLRNCAVWAFISGHLFLMMLDNDRVTVHDAHAADAVFTHVCQIVTFCM